MWTNQSVAIKFIMLSLSKSSIHPSILLSLHSGWLLFLSQLSCCEAAVQPDLDRLRVFFHVVPWRATERTFGAQGSPDGSKQQVT